ncbi:uncharacterized protein V6R79_000416 [Siganus canaliculatus]
MRNRTRLRLKQLTETPQRSVSLKHKEQDFKGGEGLVSLQSRGNERSQKSGSEATCAGGALIGPTVPYSTQKGNEDDTMATARLYRCDRNTFSWRRQRCSRVEAVHVSGKIDLCGLHRRSHLWEKKSRSVWTKPRRKTQRKSFRSIKTTTTTTTTTTRWHHRRASHTIHAHCLPVLRVG